MILKKDMRVDLHIHSTVSDGTYDVEDIVKEALAKDIGLISLTDHDDIANVERMKKVARNNNILFLPGVEISSMLNGNLIHVLAYGTDNKNEEIMKLLNKNRNMLNKKDDDTIKYLINKGYPISYSKYEEYKYDKKRGGWKALNFLIDIGLCKDMKEYFTNLCKDNKGFKFPQFTNTKEVIKIVKKAGGIPILAHPYYENDNVKVEEKLKEFLKIGIEGIECFHPNHDEEKSKLCVKWCRKNNLIITAGSDFHGDFIKQRIMGNPKVTLGEIHLGKLKDFIY